MRLCSMLKERVDPYEMNVLRKDFIKKQIEKFSKNEY